MAWLTNWNYRKQINISASADGTQTNYQMCLRIYRSSGTDGTESMGGFTAGKVYVGTLCADDYDDIRVTKSDGTTLLDYWIEESDSSDATIWIEFDSIADSGTTSFYLYYNGTTTAVSSGENTFPFYDHFDGDFTKWTEYGAGTPSIASSIATVPAQSWIGGTTTTSRPSAFRMRANMPQASGAWVAIGLNEVAPADSATDDDQLRFETSSGPSRKITTRVPPNETQTAISDFTGSYKTFDILWSSGNAVFAIDNSVVGTHTTNVPSVSQRATILNHPGESSGVTIYSDWVFLRKYTLNEPTWSSFGDEELLEKIVNVIIMF